MEWHPVERSMMDTETIPEGVDPELAAERNRLIGGFRVGEVSAEDTFTQLMELYWQNQFGTNAATDVFLMESHAQFPAEAGLSEAVAAQMYAASHVTVHSQTRD